MRVRDQNGRVLTPSVRRGPDGLWGATVWWGGINGLGTTVRRYHYATRRQARQADISHAVGSQGRVR